MPLLLSLSPAAYSTPAGAFSSCRRQAHCLRAIFDFDCYPGFLFFFSNRLGEVGVDNASGEVLKWRGGSEVFLSGVAWMITEVIVLIYLIMGYCCALMIEALWIEENRDSGSARVMFDRVTWIS